MLASPKQMARQCKHLRASVNVGESPGGVGGCSYRFWQKENFRKEMPVFHELIWNPSKKTIQKHMSNEKNLGCLECIGYYTAQLCREYNKPL